eukprot:326601-Rhodomonas_salina.1
MPALNFVQVLLATLLSKCKLFLQFSKLEPETEAKALYHILAVRRPIPMLLHIPYLGGCCAASLHSWRGFLDFDV